MDKAPVEAGKAVAPIDKIPVDGERKIPVFFSLFTREAPVETSEGAVSTNRYRLPDDYVRSILALPKEPPFEDNYLRSDNLAEIMGVTEEWLEEQRQLHKERAARTQRIADDFVLFQDMVREEFDRKGYVEVDEEYLANAAKRQEFSNELWKDMDWSDMEFSEEDDPVYACWYQPETAEELRANWHKPETAEELCSLKKTEKTMGDGSG